MAESDESKKYIPLQRLDLNKILMEAQHRWLRPAEVCELLMNHAKFTVLDHQQNLPPAHSMLMFNRQSIRYFRKDGHKWKKKKDGKTIKEAHEKLKVEGSEVLHCYYAHGEFNRDFQRRCYWMLDPDFEKYVFVHYRQVKEGYRAGSFRLPADLSWKIESMPNDCINPLLVGLGVGLSHVNSPVSVGTCYASTSTSTRSDNWNNGKTLSSQTHDQGVVSYPPIISNSPLHPIKGSLSPYTPAASMDHQLAAAASARNSLSPSPAGSWFSTGFNPNNNSTASSSFWPQVHNLSNSVISMPDQKLFVHQEAADMTLQHMLDESIDDLDVKALGGQSPEQVIQVDDSGPENTDSSCLPIEIESDDDSLHNDQKQLRKLDSFGKWMNEEMGGDDFESLITSDSVNYWTPQIESDVSEASSLSSQKMQLDIYPLDPCLGEQLFTIKDFAPNWAYSGLETKVLIIGGFLQGKEKEVSKAGGWGCMFGEIEVAAEVVGNNVLRCQVPCHVPGHFPFYVTRCNRVACSEIKYFEYREKPPGFSPNKAVQSSAEEEMHLKVRLAKLLDMATRRRCSGCSLEECYECQSRKSSIACRNDSTKEGFIESMLKVRLCEWLLLYDEVCEDVRSLDEEGQGVIHLAASLGYDWAMRPIVAAGISPNFRDAHGRTGLHWASYFGREETVLELIKLGASPGAVDDPTHSFPDGRTAADLASSRGHKGIAGYLAEAALLTDFSNLKVDPHVDIATSSGQTIDSAAQEQCSMKMCLAAVRKSAQAAALIQAALRSRSLRDKQGDGDTLNASLEHSVFGSLSKHPKMSHFRDYLHGAASKIQQNYRGWKARKEYQKTRNRIVKIQAQWRAHKAREHYKVLLWSVGIIEKLILRWRRRTAGLRGFRAQESNGKSAIDEKGDGEYDYLRVLRQKKVNGVEKALARVQSMARDQAARDQYMRLTTKHGESSSKLKDEPQGFDILSETSTAHMILLD